MSISKLEKIPSVLRKKIIVKKLKEKGIEISKGKIKEIFSLFKSTGTASLDIGDGFIIRKNYDSICCEKKEKKVEDYREVILPIGEEVIFRYKIVGARFIKEVSKTKNSFFIDYEKLLENFYIDKSCFQQ